MNNRKWDWKQTELIISLDGQSVKLRDDSYSGAYSVRTENAITHTLWDSGFICYYESQIVVKDPKHRKMYFGFSIDDNEFVLEGNAVGMQNNSVSIAGKHGFLVDGLNIPFPVSESEEIPLRDFKEGDVVGIGLIGNGRDRRIFANLNDKKLVNCPMILPANFQREEMAFFPTISIRNGGETIITNFGNNGIKWRGPIPT